MQTISSKEVAEMLGKRHDNLLRDIRKYVDALGEDAPKYFLEGDRSSRAKVLEVTLAGCELIAGRMIGEKGNTFREKYKQAFHSEEEVRKEPLVFDTLPEREDLTVEEVAKRIGCSERTVYRMIKSGRLQAIQKEIFVPTTKIFVTEEALENYIQAENGKERR